MAHPARGFFPLMLMLVIAAVLAVMSGAGWLMVHSGFRLGGDKAPSSTTTRASGDLLPEIAGQTVTIPFAHLAFTLPEGWFIYHNWSGVASSTYDQNVRVPYASMDIADAKGKVVAMVVCPPKATGMEQMGDLYDQATSSQRNFAQGTTTYAASFEYVVDYGPGHKLDYSKPRLIDTFVSNRAPIVPGFNGEEQSCQIADNTDFSQSTLDGIAAIYRSWRPAGVSSGAPTHNAGDDRAVSLSIGLSVGDWQVVPTLGALPLRVRFDARVPLATAVAMLDFGDGSKPIELTQFCSPHPYDVYGRRCAAYHTYTATGTYTATLASPSGQLLDSVAIVVDEGMAMPSATIDERTLTTTSTIPVLTGTARNVPYVRVLIPGDSNSPVFDSGIVRVVNGRWSALVVPNAQMGDSLGFETVPVNVYGYADGAGVQLNYGEGTHVLGFLASSTLTITPWQSAHPTASIDPVSLEQTPDGAPTITGTASGTNELTLYVAGFTNQVHRETFSPTDFQSFGSLIVVNGRWSRTLPNSNIDWSAGTYPIQIRDMNGQQILARGSLIIGPPAAP